MSDTQHHAIIVTTYDKQRITAALAKAAELGLTIAGPTTSPVNAWYTFLVCPDGSGVGWADSDAGDEARDAFVAWMETSRFEDRSCPFSWVEVVYGMADDAPSVTRSDWEEEEEGEE